MAKKLKDGDKIVFHNSKKNKQEIEIGNLPDVTLGRIYTIKGADVYDGANFIDDAGDNNYSIGPGSDAKWTKIVD